MIKIINPFTDIKKEDLPVIVLSDDMFSFFSWAIREHQSNIYTHSMIMPKLGFVASQELVYKERPLLDFMKPKYRLKFWKCNILSQEDKIKIINNIYKDLNASWWEKRYDFLGILGQAIHCPKLNNPWLNYCSERVAGYFRNIIALRNIIPFHPSPSDLNSICEKNSIFECLGVSITEK